MSLSLADLTTRGIRFDMDGDRMVVDAPEGVLTPDLLADIKAHRAELSDALGAIHAIQQALDAAVDWADLKTVCSTIQAAYAATQITEDAVEQLVGAVGDRSRKLPEKRPEGETASRMTGFSGPTQRIYADELLRHPTPAEWEAA